MLEIPSELFCFCNACEMAYAGAICQQLWKDRKLTVSLIFANSGVAPKKEVSIPRLELLSILIEA